MPRNRADYISDRDYSAEIVFMDDERVIYHSWDVQGEKLQHNGCRAPADFLRDWRPAGRV